VLAVVTAPLAHAQVAPPRLDPRPPTPGDIAMMRAMEADYRTSHGRVVQARAYPDFAGIELLSLEPDADGIGRV
jgi:hypothetical protein